MYKRQLPDTVYIDDAVYQVRSMILLYGGSDGGEGNGDIAELLPRGGGRLTGPRTPCVR